MRNSEVVRLVESVNNVLQNDKIANDQLVPLSRWAQMGVEEDGATAYRIIKILVAELQQSRSEAVQTLVANGETNGFVNLGTPISTLTELDEETLYDDEVEEDLPLHSSIDNGMLKKTNLSYS